MLILANLYLQQDVSLEYIIVDFICIGLLDLFGARAENFKMKNSCPQLDSNPVPFAYDANSLGVAPLDLTFIEHFKVDRLLRRVCY